jgi:hypothetical protein
MEGISEDVRETLNTLFEHTWQPPWFDVCCIFKANAELEDVEEVLGR